MGRKNEIFRLFVTISIERVGKIQQPEPIDKGAEPYPPSSGDYYRIAQMVFIVRIVVVNKANDDTARSVFEYSIGDRSFNIPLDGDRR